MTDQLKKRLSALREIAPRLNAVADQANEIVKSVEKALVEEMKLGISAKSKWFDSECSRRSTKVLETTYKHLAFGRAIPNGNQCIYVHTSVTQPDPENAWRELEIDRSGTPWSSCDRETRLRAFEMLPELLDNIINAANVRVKAADETAAKIRKMTENETTDSVDNSTDN